MGWQMASPTVDSSLLSSSVTDSSSEFQPLSPSSNSDFPDDQLHRPMASIGTDASQGGGSGEDRSKGSLINLPFLKSFGDKRVTKDGQAPKKRGPKPDTKPALTRRQELNRQAQRTHRERKEHYIRALEQEVMRLKESFTATTQEKDAVTEENRQLRELLKRHNISERQISFSPSAPSGPPSLIRDTSSNGLGTSPGLTTNHTQSHGITPPPSTGQFSSPVPREGQQQNFDIEQTGVDFVLTYDQSPNPSSRERTPVLMTGVLGSLERPCMEHMPFLSDWSGQSEDNIFGHALMASCPPEDHIFNHAHQPLPVSDETFDLDGPNLKTLLALSAQLDLDGEITPVMAWRLILNHERFNELTPTDFAAILEDLKTKVRCYGFGAVLEEFEVRDALSSVFATKLESYSVFN